MRALSAKTVAYQNRCFGELTAAIETAHSIAICAHTSPDGDALGSELALAKIIDTYWAGSKTLRCLLADGSPVPKHYRFLPGAKSLCPPQKNEEAPDLFLCVDLSVASRLNRAQPLMEAAKTVYVLDHHPSGVRFWTSGCIRPEAAACGVIVAEYALYLGIPITPDIATLLLVAVVTDTGRFQYQNADAEAFGVASLLVDAGASPSNVALHVYQSFSLAYLKLEAIVMGRITLAAQGALAYSWALWEDFLTSGASEDEADGLVDIVRSVEDVQVALLLRQTPKGTFRGNLRSKGDLDVSVVAQRLGGGGHPAAAGFTLKATTIEEALLQVVPLIETLIANEWETRVD